MDSTMYDVVVIGGGIIGLSTAMKLKKEKFPDWKIAVVEKDHELASHQTGHNSGVIHAGVYYTPGSLKAQFCFEGNRAIKAFCREHDIAFDECGKLLVATSAVELERMQALIERSRQNGLTIEILDKAQLAEAEPNITGVGAIRVPSTGIVSYTAICQRLAELIEADGGVINYNSQVTGLGEDDSGVAVKCSGVAISAGKLIACGGVMADRLFECWVVSRNSRSCPFAVTTTDWQRATTGSSVT